MSCDLREHCDVPAPLGYKLSLCGLADPAGDWPAFGTSKWLLRVSPRECFCTFIVCLIVSLFFSLLMLFIVSLYPPYPQKNVNEFTKLYTHTYTLAQNNVN